jgi:fatty acid desaturase
VNWIALAVMCFCYAGGIALIVPVSLKSILGIFLVAEAMLLSWYLAHECAHLSVFKRKSSNIALGEVLTFFTVGSFFPFKDFRRNHLRHHVEKIDLVGFDLQQALATYPGLVKSLILAMESIYIPAAFFLVKWATIIGEIRTAGPNRLRILGFLSIYGLIYGFVVAHWPETLALYILSVFLRIHCIRFVDAFQHTYDRTSESQRPELRGRQYEHNNTFSFPVARRFKFLNLLILNFGFHNAHHAFPGCSWYNLPRADRAFQTMNYSTHPARESPFKRCNISIWSLFRSYHQNRVRRISFTSPISPYGQDTKFNMASFLGSLSDDLLG